MQKLNFPAYEFRFKSNENKALIFDPIRKKFVILTPEEWVRQHTLQFLLQEFEISKSLINVEKQLVFNALKKRYDLVVFKTDGKVSLIAECKAPTVSIDQAVFDQIARYNLITQADYLMITNGLSHYFCRMDYTNERYVFLESLPPVFNK